MGHVEQPSGRATDLSAFERAVDAIVTGDLDALDALLEAHPDLVHARSDREHRATLLHYVSANGVEDYRQRTPANIVAIARRLLDAGAEIEAEADMYGGGSRTLGLVVTSAHPRKAGVQLALADLLLERGARVDPGIVRYCLMNGCPEAAAHMAARGAAVDLDEAAGLGRLDLMANYLEALDSVSEADAAAALVLASWYDQREVIGVMLDHGVDAGLRTAKDGRTALHIAAYVGNPKLVELLLMRGAPVDAQDDVHETPPLVWALHACFVERRDEHMAYRTVLRMLLDAGARVEPAWIEDERLRAHPDLYAALAARADAAGGGR